MRLAIILVGGGIEYLRYFVELSWFSKNVLNEKPARSIEEVCCFGGSMIGDIALIQFHPEDAVIS